MSLRKFGNDALVIGTRAELEALFGNVTDIVFGKRSRVIVVPEGIPLDARVRIVTAAVSGLDDARREPFSGRGPDGFVGIGRA